MTSVTTRLLTLAIIAGAIPAPVLAWEPPADAQRTLAVGRPWDEVLPDGHGGGMIHAAIDIAAPPSVVWSILTRCGPNHLSPTMKSCKVLQGDQRSGWDVRERISKGSLFTPSIRDVIYTQYTAPQSVRFHRVDGDLKAEEGETRLESLNGGTATRVVYVNHIAFNTILPDGILRTAMRHVTPEVLLNLQRNSLAASGPGPFAAYDQGARLAAAPQGQRTGWK